MGAPSQRASQLASQDLSGPPNTGPQPWPPPQPQPQQLRGGPMQQVYFVTYLSVRHQMLDEEVWFSLARQHCQGLDRLLRQEHLARKLIDGDRGAHAQAQALATRSREQLSRLMRLQLLEVEHRAAILPNERREREGILSRTVWAARRREISVWEDRRRIALLGVS